MQVLHSFPDFNFLRTHYPQIKTILWDMDGTVLDTEKLHFESIFALISTPDCVQSFKEFCHGKIDSEVFDHLLEANLIQETDLDGFLNEKEIKLRELIQSTPLDEILAPSLREFITQLRDNQFKQAIVTSSERITTDFSLKVTNILGLFDLIITREDTPENKPSPMPYQHAMRTLGVNPETVLIFEDSEVGHLAATKSGAQVVKAAWY